MYVQKIQSFIFKIYKIVIASFLIEDKLHKICFFRKTFLITDKVLK